MNTLISILLSIINNTLADNTTREIAVQLLKAYPELESIKASQIAERSFCNTSTVNRFCKSIGFQSFLDLKSFMMSSHSVRQAQLKHHLDLSDDKRILNNISVLCNGGFDEKDFVEHCRAFNETVFKAPHAIVVGAVYPEALTFHYMEDMIEMGKCIYNAPIARQLNVPNEETDTAVILISFTGRLIRYCASEFNTICEKYPHAIVMTADKDLISSTSPEKVFPLPFNGDDEANNAAFIEIMRYLKYDYYVRYYKG